MTTQNIANLCEIERAVNSMFDDSTTECEALNMFFMLVDVISDPIVMLSAKKRWKLAHEVSCIFSRHFVAYELRRREGIKKPYEFYGDHTHEQTGSDYDLRGIS